VSASNENPAGGPQAPVTPAGGDAPKPFAPMVMGPPSGSFAPQVMGPPSGSFAPQVMGPPPVTVAPSHPEEPKPSAAPASTPEPVPPAPISSPFEPTGGDAALVAAFAGEAPPAEAGPAPPAMLAPMGESPAAANGEAVATPAAPGLVDPPAEKAAPSADDELAASPWNRANNPGLNRDLLPSAMVAAAPEPPAASKKAARAPVHEVPSRTPWVIVGLLVVVAIAGGVAVFMIQGQRGSGSGGPIAVPAGRQTSNNDDTPAATAAPSVTATATATATAVVAPRPLSTYRPGGPLPFKGGAGKAPSDDPYSDTPSRGKSPAPGATSTAAKGRIFGSDPY
jgi:hypothetical protein